MLLSEAKEILKNNGYRIVEGKGIGDEITDKRLRKLLDGAGYSDVHLIKGNGYLYVVADDDQHSDWLSAFGSTSIYCNSYNQQTPEEWFHDIILMLRHGRKEFIDKYPDGPIDEDFGVGVASCGADQGIPHGGDCKAVVPTRFGKLQRRDLPMRMKKRKKRK